MPVTVNFQVGSWVTLRTSSRQSRARKDAQTPALITALNIEGSEAATVVFPNHLALRFGFQCSAWKRQEGVPLKMLKVHQGQSKALEAALLAALRSERSVQSQPSETAKRALSPAASAEGSEKKAAKTGLYQWLVPRGTPGTEAPVVSPEPKKAAGLKQWMKPGSVWEAEVDPLASLRVAMQPFGKAPRASAASSQVHGEVKETMMSAEGKVDAKEAEAVEKVMAETETTAVQSEIADENGMAEEKTSASDEEDAISDELSEDEQVDFLAAMVPVEDGCLAPPPSPQSPLAQRFSTPSPQKASAQRATPQKGKEVLENFTKLLAQTFASKRCTQLSKMELYECVKTSDSKENWGVFEDQLQELDSQNKVAVIDDMIFSL